MRPGPVTVGIRPEDLAPDPAGAVTGTVRLIERLGAETYVLFGERGAQRTWRIPGAVALGPGEAIRLAAPARAAASLRSRHRRPPLTPPGVAR